jgi:hypothetical protein
MGRERIIQKCIMLHPGEFTGKSISRTPDYRVKVAFTLFDLRI